MFYKRLNELCLENATSVAAVADKVLHVSSGTPTGWKNGTPPKASTVIDAAKYFNVSSDYLLGLSDDRRRVSQDVYVLDKEEAVLVTDLRKVAAPVRSAVLRMATSALSTSQLDAMKFNSDSVFLSLKGGDSHHAKEQHGMRTGLKRVEGAAAAGKPIAAAPDSDRSVRVPDKYLNSRYFVIRARGDSMVGANIDDGDLCVFDRNAYRDEGAIMLVQVEGYTDQPDATIKRVYFHLGSDWDGDDAQIELRSANPAYEPMFYPAREVSISGVLVDVLTPREDE